MSLAGILVLEAAILVALPYFAWRFLGIRHIAPLAVIQIVCGLALGPSVLGHFAPGVQQALFGAASLAALSGVATIAVVLFSFISGMHLDIKSFRSAGRADLSIAVSSFVVPLLLGAGLGIWLASADPALVGPNASVPVFASAIGICLAVTALPVLAALLKEMKIVNSDLGQQALGFAAMTDGALWISVSALLIVAAEARGGLWLLALIPAYLGAALFLMPLLMGRAASFRPGNGEASDTVLILGVTLAFGSAFLAELSGLGYVIGAFLAGAAMPGGVRAELTRRLDWPVTLLLMPFFFMVTGLRTEADLLSAPVLLMAAGATALAIAGKLAGVAVPAMLLGRNTRRSLALAVLLQSKGLMEVLVVTVLIDAGILTGRVFSALVLVAVFCTILAMPLTRLILGSGRTREALIGFRGLEAGV